MSRLAVDLARALDPAALAEGVGMVPDAWQAEVLRSDHPRILLNCCRQSGKSQTAAVKAVHCATFEASSLVLLLSPSQRQSAELFLKVLAVYKTLGRQVPSSAESATTLVLENGSRVVSLPGTDATVRSFSSVRLLIVDEAARVADETYFATSPMLAVSGGQMIALSTPAGPTGWWAKAWEEGKDFERYRVPASDVPRIPASFLASERALLGPHAYSAEYECAFVSGAFALFDEAALQAMFTPDFQPLYPQGV